MSKLFKPFRALCGSDHPKWWQYLLLPFYYVAHWFDYLIIKGAMNYKKAKAYVKGDEKTALEKLYKKIGVKKG